MICRWRHPSGLILDAMPSDPSILGFANQWQGAAIPHAIEHRLHSGTIIRAVSPPYLLATKLEAFKGRGNRDFLASRDVADIVALVDGREELIGDVAEASPDVRDSISADLTELLRDARFADGIFGALRPDTASQARADAVIPPPAHPRSLLAGPVVPIAMCTFTALTVPLGTPSRRATCSVGSPVLRSSIAWGRF